jgi:hypothetical protein
MSAVEHDRFTELSLKIGDRVFLDVQVAAQAVGISARQLGRIIKSNNIQVVWFTKRKLKVVTASLLDFFRSEPTVTSQDKRRETIKRNR